jgi:precorrin-6B methylase 2
MTLKTQSENTPPVGRPEDTMTLLQRSTLAGIVMLALIGGSHAWAQPATPPEPYKPTVGQAGKDVVWVPSSPAMVEKMLDHASVTPQDFVMDLGSGDGRAIIAAARRGARALGIEYNADLVEYSKRQAAAAGVADKAMFAQGDMYEADISKATVLMLFLLPTNLEKLAPKFMQLPPGTRIVANTFWLSEWTPDETQELQDGCESWCTSHLIIVPARVEGKWRVGDGVLSLTQKFQQVEGAYTPANGAFVPVKGSLRGSEMMLTVGDAEYQGSVKGDTIEGAAKSSASGRTLVARRMDPRD